MKRVILESPYAGDIEANVDYARACVRDSLTRGEAPIASHLLYTQPGILKDEVPEERQWGIDAGLAWATSAEATVVYTDRGVSRGMSYGIDNATKAGRPIEYRKIYKRACNHPHVSTAEYVCRCHQKMGNDFYFLPADRCLHEPDPKGRVLITE
jgi:hypothetical protein